MQTSPRPFLLFFLFLTLFVVSCKKDDPASEDSTNDGGNTSKSDTVYSDVLNILDASENTIFTEGYLVPEFCRFASDLFDGTWMIQVQRPNRTPFVSRIKNNHSIDWIKSLGVNSATPLGLIPVSDGAIIFLRSSALSQTLIIKLDQEGNKVWEKSSDYFVQSFNAERTFITEASNGNILYSGESSLVEFDLQGEIVNAYTMDQTIEMTLEYQDAYYCFSRKSLGSSYTIFKLNDDLSQDTSVTIAVAGFSMTLRGAHISETGKIIAFFNVDNGQSGMHNRIYSMDGDMENIETKKGVMIGDNGQFEYMFTDLQPGSTLLPSGEYGFGIFRSRGNLGNPDLGFHMIVFGNDLSYGLPYHQTSLFGTGAVYNDGMGNAGILTLSTSEALLSYPVSNLGSCAGAITYTLSSLPNDDLLESTSAIAATTETSTTQTSGQISVSDFTVKVNALEFCNP